ncbi:MAG: hypothetical protein AAGA99_22660 [Actinomycetota bacterium]
MEAVAPPTLHDHRVLGTVAAAISLFVVVALSIAQGGDSIAQGSSLDLGAELAALTELGGEPLASPAEAATAAASATGVNDRRATMGASLPTTAPAPPIDPGYVMVRADGAVHGFGAAASVATGEAGIVDAAGVGSVDGTWILGTDGVVTAIGALTDFGDVETGLLLPGEQLAAIAAVPDGSGYWVVTDAGRVITFGTAANHGDLFDAPLNGSVVAAVGTPTGSGYYLVGSDGGVFAFGDAAYRGSMAAAELNAPLVDIALDRDGGGYWLIGADGGVFAFDAEFRGSLNDAALNEPIVAAAPFGDGYLLAAADGGIFNFSELPFLGSLSGQSGAGIVGLAARS